jgi:hypothetical protein
LTFNGQCEAAFTFYEKCLRVRIQAALVVFLGFFSAPFVRCAFGLAYC